MLMLMTGQWTNGVDPLQIPAAVAHAAGRFTKLSDLPPEQRQQVLADDFTRFIIVRHPFERLLSAYRNKLESDSSSSRYFQTRIGRQIIKHFRPQATKAALEKGNDVSFLEFIQYLMTPELSQSVNQSYNEHWESVTNLCRPCTIKYNVIGKYETLIDDSALALHLAGADHLSFPAAQKTSGTSELLRRYFDQIPIYVTRGLYKLYEQDFKLFGYNLEDVLGFDLG